MHVQVLGTQLQGEARLVGQKLAKTLRTASVQNERPFCLIMGGETTVTVRGTGKGGRNQELALGAVDALEGLQNVLLVSLATDGDDGPTDAAGAVVTGETRGRGHAAGMRAADYLARNDAYHYFEPLGDLLKPGYSGTNVNDLIFLLAL
jgi:hydroxypyruvate reductase